MFIQGGTWGLEPIILAEVTEVVRKLRSSKVQGVDEVRTERNSLGYPGSYTLHYLWIGKLG